MMDEFREKIVEQNNLADISIADQERWFDENVFSKFDGNDYSKLFECFESTPIGRQSYKGPDA